MYIIYFIYFPIPFFIIYKKHQISPDLSASCTKKKKNYYLLTLILIYKSLICFLNPFFIKYREG